MLFILFSCLIVLASTSVSRAIGSMRVDVLVLTLSTGSRQVLSPSLLLDCCWLGKLREVALRDWLEDLELALGTEPWVLVFGACVP